MRFLLTKLSHFFIFFLGLSVTAPPDLKPKRFLFLYQAVQSKLPRFSLNTL